ncbi:MAG: hypothetical protein MUQ65_12025 [Armatimonadetes bacterium]|nr:hypothetical protein [Armatimonadota bacterium]
MLCCRGKTASAAAEENTESLVRGRRDAYCGMLRASHNFGLRSVRIHIPQMPVGLSEELAPKIAAFADCGMALFDAVQLLGIEDINVPLPNTMLYAGENPFEVC